MCTSENASLSARAAADKVYAPLTTPAGALDKGRPGLKTVNGVGL